MGPSRCKINNVASANTNFSKCTELISDKCVNDEQLEQHNEGVSPKKGQLDIWTKHMDDGRLLCLFTPRRHHKKTLNSGSRYYGLNTRLRGYELCSGDNATALRVANV